MRIIKTLTGKVKKFVRKNGGTLPKLYVKKMFSLIPFQENVLPNDPVIVGSTVPSHLR